MRALAGRCCAIAVLAAALPSAQDQEPEVGVILRAAASYVAEYEQALAVVGQEEYTQQASGQQRRMLRSDILFMQDDAFGWVEFRDVAERDGSPVRDREERLLALFSKPNADRRKQAQRIVAEGARFNIDPGEFRLNRTINLPLTALRFLRAADQFRSAFKVAQWNRRTNLVSVEFVEQHHPRLITTPDHRAATGRFEIDRASGRVTASRLTLPSATTVATIVVKFGDDANVRMWLPLSMEEQYFGPFAGSVTGLARYSRYRRFRVDTSTDIARN
jgi:hypothetical protein